MLEFNDTNLNGNGMYHAFGMWFMIRKLGPPVLVESGVFQGLTSWLMRKASADWEPIFFRIDPVKRGWEDDVKDKSKIKDYRGLKDFKDFNAIPWKDLLPDERQNAVILFDDHQDHLVRLQQARQHGFKHILFDDNYVPGFGDMFSIKGACDGGKDSSDMNGHGGAIRKIFSKVPQRCQWSIFGARFCHNLSEQEASMARSELLNMSSIIWEMPPLTPLHNPYGRLQQLVKPGLYDGPSENEWKENVHSCLINDMTKPALFPDVAEAKQRLHVNDEDLRFEERRYINLAYVQVRE